MVPTQETDTREYPQRPIAGVAVWVFRGDSVLLAQRGQPPGEGYWSAPGGAIELGETLHQAAQRELREECSIEISVIKVIDVADVVVRDEAGRVRFHYVLTHLLARHVSGEARAGSDALAVRWVGREDLGTLDIIPGVRENLRKAFDLAHESGLF